MDPQLETLGAQLAATAVRNTSGTILGRITAVKARKRDQETIGELEELVNDLLSDKSELVRIAKAYEDQLIAQSISEEDVRYVTDNLVPLLKSLINAARNNSEADATEMEQMIDAISAILSVETITILQLLGFNFRRAIGDPLTDLVASLIASKAQPTPDQGRDIEALRLQREVIYMEIARDPEAFQRLQALSGNAG